MLIQLDRWFCPLKIMIAHSFHGCTVKYKKATCWIRSLPGLAMTFFGVPYRFFHKSSARLYQRKPGIDVPNLPYYKIFICIYQLNSVSHVYIHTYICIYIYVYIDICISTYIFIYVYVHIYIYVCMYVCTYVWHGTIMYITCPNA